MIVSVQKRVLKKNSIDRRNLPKLSARRAISSMQTWFGKRPRATIFQSWTSRSLWQRPQLLRETIRGQKHPRPLETRRTLQSPWTTHRDWKASDSVYLRDRQGRFFECRTKHIAIEHKDGSVITHTHEEVEHHADRQIVQRVTPQNKGHSVESAL